ncbi:MAG TPA: hypothetical protein VIH72_00715 [Candidatus Acidoferrales bacterium]|jgi:hypothetical protein
MRGKFVTFGLILGMVAGVSGAQVPRRTTVDPTAMYCSGAVTSDAVPQDSYVISGEQSVDKVGFVAGQLVYINRGSGQGVKVGDEFLVIRSVKDELKEPWFKGQDELLRAMGRTWADEGRLKVVHVGDKVSTAEVKSTCDYIQRGDVVLPFQERPAPPLKQDAQVVDQFAPATGKTGMIVASKYFGQASGSSSIVYVNIGASQGVRVGSYLRVFRNQGRGVATIYQDKGTEYKLFGFGSTPVAYEWPGLPREILGEGIVLRVSGNTATLMLTDVRREIYQGDYVELEQ